MRGFDFCRRHTDVIHGILLGLTVLDGPEQEQAAARTSPGEPPAPPRKTVVN